jgi:phosphonate transport system substrate-binding protein
VNRVLIITALECLLIIAFSGCEKAEEAKEVRLGEREALRIEEAAPETAPLRIAVGAMITPKEGFAYYKRLLDYIEEKMDMQVKFVDKESYAEINSLLRSGEIDVAFVCSGPYVDGHDEFGLKLLVVPQAYGETVYYSYVIVPAESPVEDFHGLRGKTFAFTDPKSNTGKLVPTYVLAKMGEPPGSFFGKHIFTYAHDKSIKLVAMGLVDGAAVDSLIWEYANKTNPEHTSKTRIIWKSPPYGIPPVAVRPGIGAGLEEKLKETLLGVHEDEEGREILKGMMIERFVPGDDRAYDTIRRMKDWVARRE